MDYAKFEALDFVLIECARCSVPFMVTKDCQRKRREDKQGFHCPNKHSNYYPGKTEAEKLREELERQKKQTEHERYMRNLYQRDEERARKELSTKKGQLTKLKKRVGNGVCPCCNRSFASLREHMKHMHPEFVLDTEVTPPEIEKEQVEQGTYKMTTADAIAKLGKAEFTAQELLEFLKQNGVDRDPASVQASLSLMKAQAKITPVKGAGMLKVWKTSA